MVLKQKQIKHGEIQNPIREMRCFLLQKLSSWFWLNKRTKGFDGNEEKGNIWCYCKQKTSLKRREAERIQRKKKAVLVSLFLSLPDSNCRSQQQPFLCPLNSSLSVSSCVSVELDILGGLEGEMVVVVLINDNATERWYFFFIFFLSLGQGLLLGPQFVGLLQLPIF